ncbi:TetR/AcrR family transcriptional regulator [Amycolatopsis rifamycinica]|uniref:TetR family transcriptional regulator n=1 Tax=Amycolatopsis rifamycinica TaxID=287986 RepID=A0A066U8H6_9PSEU|nr:TetR/AcrR family transcriptional regulator [Amycolatopsis rifamycinica]KDN23741.1 TetR family transcriptional regulator [Amycolatopsis rifamycinica]
MARWQGNTRERLERAALELFREQGYDRTTVAQIAQHAGLTERSFYRWFTDKREVLFAGDELQACLEAGIAKVPAETGALATLMAAFTAVPEVLRPREVLIELRAVIAANPPLRERSLIKEAMLSEVTAAALRRRGHDEQTARLATALGMAILASATRRWVLGEEADFATLLAGSAADLLAVAADLPPVHTETGRAPRK